MAFISGSLLSKMHKSFIGTEFTTKVGGIFKIVGVISLRGKEGKIGTPTIYGGTCTVCSPDHEMYGDGVFEAFKGSLKSGSFPCGCGGADA